MGISGTGTRRQTVRFRQGRLGHSRMARISRKSRPNSKVSALSDVRSRNVFEANRTNGRRAMTGSCCTAWRSGGARCGSTCSSFSRFLQVVVTIAGGRRWRSRRGGHVLSRVACLVALPRLGGGVISTSAAALPFLKWAAVSLRGDDRRIGPWRRRVGDDSHGLVRTAGEQTTAPLCPGNSRLALGHRQ
jgi:hypothetical protein